MKLIEFFEMAINAIMSTKLRSALTMLGMIIGVGAVIILMSVGAGLQNMITDTFSELGSNTLFIQPSGKNRKRAVAARMCINTCLGALCS